MNDLWLVGLAQPLVVEPAGGVNMLRRDYNGTLLDVGERQRFVEDMASGRKKLPLVIDHAGLEDAPPGTLLDPAKVIGETVDAFLDGYYHVWVVARIFAARPEAEAVLWSMTTGGGGRRWGFSFFTEYGEVGGDSAVAGTGRVVWKEVTHLGLTVDPAWGDPTLGSDGSWVVRASPSRAAIGRVLREDLRVFDAGGLVPDAMRARWATPPLAVHATRDSVRPRRQLSRWAAPAPWVRPRRLAVADALPKMADANPVAPATPTEPSSPAATPEQRRQAAAAVLARLTEKADQAEKHLNPAMQHDILTEVRREFEEALGAKAQYDLPTLAQFGARLPAIDAVLARNIRAEMAKATEALAAEGYFPPSVATNWNAAMSGDVERPLDVESKANALVVFAHRAHAQRSQLEAERFRQLHQQAEAAKAEALALAQTKEADVTSLKRKHEEEAAGLQRKLEETEAAFKKYKADMEARVALPPATAAAAAASTLGQHAAPPAVAAVAASATSSPSSAELTRASAAAGEALYNKYKASWLRTDPAATSRS